MVLEYKYGPRVTGSSIALVPGKKHPSIQGMILLARTDTVRTDG